MTTIEFGGGPKLEARRRFANLKDGAEIPRYAGHVHQLRFRQGHTFSDETHLLSKEFPRLKRAQSHAVSADQPDPYVTREFPDGLIPGYAGYVPQRKNQHGHRYRVETDSCTSETKSTYEKGRQKIKDLTRTINSYPKTKAINNDKVVHHFLDYHRAYHPTENSERPDRRPFVEGPIPGYKGYVPRMIPIGVGLGLCYKDAAKKALDRFAFETTNSKTNLSKFNDDRASLKDFDTQSNASFSTSLTDFGQSRATTSSSSRVFARSGMIPRYAGYLPQRKYRVGQTFGDTTRDLPVCAHSFASYGDLVRSNSFLDSSITNFN